MKIVFVGFIARVKGVRELVEACLQLREYNIELDLLGKAPDPVLRKELEKISGASGKTEWIRFHGGVDHAEVLQHILAADLLVLPSHAESAPAAVIEAMGCAKPVVSTTTGTIPEMLDIGGPEQCGICVAPRDVNALAEAIRRLIDDPRLRQEFAGNGRRRAERLYAVPVGCRQLVDLWRSVAK